MQRINNIFDDRKVSFPASILSGAKFNVYPQFSRIVLSDRVTSLKEFCAASTKGLLMQCLLHKYKSKLLMSPKHIKSTWKAYHHTASM